MKSSIVLMAILAIAVFATTGCEGGKSSAGKASPSPSQPEGPDPTDTQAPAAHPTPESADPTDTQAPAAHATPGPADLTAENDFAESMLLTLGDFPLGWVHEPDAGEDPLVSAPNPLEACIDKSFPGQTGSAIGGEFSDEDRTRLSINPSVYVFDSAANARSAAATIVSSVQCDADVIGDGLDVDERFAFGRTYTEPLVAEPFGATAAIRLLETQIYKNQQPPRSDVLVFDIVIIVDGRVLTEVDGFQRHSPIDQSLLQRYVHTAQEKIRQEP
jgi:hypothetical protein